MKFRNFFTVFLSVFSLCMFFSCSQVNPDVTTVNYSVIYDYPDTDSFPEIRLGLFADLQSDAHRAETITAVCKSNGYRWEVSNPLKIENSKKKYAGYTNFVMPENELFPSGSYTLIYRDASGKENTIDFSLVYDRDFSELKVPDAIPLLEKQGTCYFAVYDGNGILTAYAMRESEDQDAEYIWRRYPGAQTMRPVWTTSGGNTMCILPPVNKTELPKETE